MRTNIIKTTLTLVTLLSISAAAAEKIEVSEKNNIVEIKIDGKVFTKYHYADADRPYFYPVLAPTGDNITRKWPMEDTNKDEQQDHRHQRSLWFTHGSVNGLDFWSEGKGPKIVQVGLETKSDGRQAEIKTINEWRSKEGRVVCTDTRRHLIKQSGENRIFDFEIEIRASHGAVTLGDTKEGSMAFRTAPTLRLKGKVAQGHIVNSEGVKDEDAWGKYAKWCDYYGPLNGKTVGIAIMDHPDNPRHPTRWHARDYGLCAANPFFGQGEIKINEGESLMFKYRVFIHNGTTEEADIEKHYLSYINDKAQRK